MQIAVRPTGSGSYTTLSPRVKINPTPYAIRAGVASPIGAAGGDLSGRYPYPTVARLQGRSVSSTAPSSGQVLKWNGSTWAPAADDVRRLDPAVFGGRECTQQRRILCPKRSLCVWHSRRHRHQNDLWVQRYSYQTEQEKEDAIKDKYLQPELYGQPKERGIHYRPEPEPAPIEQAKP
ncbi:MAG: hypothetical protein K6U77_11270 [Armatimonadetes bacterium]|nr:hypothetical protein [Armatimonadota bacterium]